jgi:hypothetical protein
VSTVQMWMPPPAFRQKAAGLSPCPAEVGSDLKPAAHEGPMGVTMALVSQPSWEVQAWALQGSGAGPWSHLLQEALPDCRTPQVPAVTCLCAWRPVPC